MVLRFPLCVYVGLAILALCSGKIYADGPADNQPDQVRPIPPTGIEISSTVIEALEWRCQVLRAQWQSALKKNPSIAGMESEVLVFPRAVEMVIEFNQFYKANEPEQASVLLDESARRIEIIQRGGSWSDVVGIEVSDKPQLVIGGYTSKIDGSIQPYGIVIPAGFDPTDIRPRRLDIWFHGRGEKLSEVTFLNKQSHDLGQYAPNDTIVLHPYGRYSNAFKFAGEVDVLEAIEYVQLKLPIDKNKISVRGFSMGGAACWQFATHYADRWFAANPGAGFSETPKFLASFQNEDVRSTAPRFQQRLWQLYDCPPWAINLAQCPTIAYSGEIDRQKQAADVMQERLNSIGIDLVHVIGPQTGHKIHPDSKIEIERRMQALANAVRPSIPNHIQFTTTTLRYPSMHWVKLTGLESHWTPATVEAEVDDALVRVNTENVSRIAFEFKSGQWPGKRIGQITVEIDGDRLAGPLVRSDQSWTWRLEKQDDHWAPASNESTLHKRPGLQGPIDDAFMDSFLFVLPSGHSEDEVVEKWVESESLHAMHHWRKHFRGDIRKKLDNEVTADDIDSTNLILFGDPESNSIIQLITGELPLQWEAERIKLGEYEVDRKNHVPVLIYPNPLNPNHYVVINSGFTFREYDYLNNARQTPKLPDWALLDVTDGPTNQLPGKIRAAGFFNESWIP